MVIESKDVGKCADDKELIELQLESEPKAGQFEHEFEKKRVGGEGNVRGKQKSVHKPKEKAHQKRGSLDSHEKEKKSPIEKRRVGHQAKEKEAQIGKVSYEIKELEQLEEEAVVKREKLNQHKKETVQERRKPGHDGYEKEITSSRRVPDDKHEVKTAKQSSHRVEEETVRQKEKVVHHKIKEVVCEEENLEKHKIKETIGESGKPRHHRYEQEAIQKRLKPALYKDVSVQARRELETFGEKYKEKEEASKRTHHRPTEKAKHEKGEPCPHKHQVEIVYERVRPTHHELEEKPVKGKKKSGSLDLKEKTKKSKSICHRCEKQIRSGKPSSHVYKETIRERKKHSSPKHEEVGKGRKSFQHKSEAEVVSEGTPEHEAKKQKSPCKRETPVQPQVREIPQIQFEGRIAQRRYIRIHGLIPPRVIIDEECDVLLKQLDSDNDNQFEVSTPDYLKVEEGQIRILGSEGSKEYVCGKVEHELKKVVEHDPDHSCIVESALLPPESEEESGSSISQHSNQWMSVQRTQSYLNLRATSKRHSRKAKAERLRLFYVSQSPKHTEHGRSSSTECHPSTSKQQGCGYHSRFEKGLEPTPSTSRQQLHSHHLHTPQLGPSTSQQQIHKYHSRSPEFHPLSSSRKIHRHQSHSPQNQRSLMLSKQRREYSVSPQHDSASSKKQRGYSCSPGPHLSTSREQDSKEQATHHSCSLEHSSSSPTWWKSKFFFPPSQYPGSKGKDEENEDKSESSGES
ncbi:uncharacterized protein LOC142323361 [Lycorma delicatula]|uniref:uncharacterized protein LOC142323361 n=1 Tax=Lycorma delicatula TaxID=130591 RepID=UPI003F512483